jgi:Mg2+ and Co2+ transporter CorA
MADPLSLTGSILAIVSTGIRVANGIHQLADELCAADSEIHSYADEIIGFTRLLQHVHTTVKDVPSSSDTLLEQGLIREALTICEKILTPLDQLQKTLNKHLEKLKPQSSKLKRFGTIVKWVFSSKKKVLFYRAALHFQHQLLDTILQLLTLRSSRPQNTIGKYVKQFLWF